MPNVKICPYCNGTGKEYDGNTCVACHGVGKVQKDDLVTDPDYYKD